MNDIFFFVKSSMALAMASSHSSLSVAELKEQDTSESPNGEQQSTPTSLFIKWIWVRCWPGRQDKRPLHTLNVQFILIGFLAGFAHLENTLKSRNPPLVTVNVYLYSVYNFTLIYNANKKRNDRTVAKTWNMTALVHLNELTFIPARERILLSLYCADWTGVVYISASLN